MFLVTVTSSESSFLLPNSKCYYVEALIGGYLRSGCVVYLVVDRPLFQARIEEWLTVDAGRD